MIRRLLYKFQTWVRNYENDAPDMEANTVREREQADIEGLRFTVMPARGGTIVQLRKYNDKRDENEYTTYVIPDGEDIPAEVGKIVGMEIMKA